MPITFECSALLRFTPQQVADQILDLDGWAEFTGYGPLPGIRQASFAVRTDIIVGTRIAVTNTDGSQHIEEIMAWDLPERLHMRLQEFSPPLSRLASHFDEVWTFEPTADGLTRARRRLQLHARSPLAMPLLWLISWGLKGAIRKHLRQIAEAESGDVVRGSG